MWPVKSHLRAGPEKTDPARAPEPVEVLAAWISCLVRRPSYTGTAMVVLQVAAVPSGRIRSTSALSVSMVPGSRLEETGGAPPLWVGWQ